MRYVPEKKYKKRKHYKIKVLPVLLTTSLLLLLVTMGLMACHKIYSQPEAPDTPKLPMASTLLSEPSSRLASSLIPSERSSTESMAEVSSPSSESSSIQSESKSKEPSSLPMPSSKSDPALSSEQSSVSPSASELSSEEQDRPTPQTGMPAGSLTDWNLILLNPEPDNKIDQELDIEKTQFDTQWVDSRAAPAYREMSAAAAGEGITLYLRSGYRSIQTQAVNYNANVQREIARGKSEEEAIRLTNLYYTVPGHSEHHTGLAFDIITPEYHKYVYELDGRFADTDAYQWLLENCADYGFILRYPKEKESITQINFEPWHYRYVGIEHAQYIMENGLCLEEYINLLKGNLG